MPALVRRRWWWAIANAAATKQRLLVSRLDHRNSFFGAMPNNADVWSYDGWCRLSSSVRWQHDFAQESRKQNSHPKMAHNALTSEKMSRLSMTLSTQLLEKQTDVLLIRNRNHYHYHPLPVNHAGLISNFFLLWNKPKTTLPHLLRNFMFIIVNLEREVLVTCCDSLCW